MFLATTALREFWKPDDNLLMLGAWCVPFGREAELRELRYEIMPCPWQDRVRFHETAGYLDACYERLLRSIAAYMNKVQGVTFSIRYWRILLGPWLQHYIHAFHDRYAHLKAAFDNYSDLRTVAVEPECFHTPLDTANTIDLFNTDAFNLQIFSQILASLGLRFPLAELTIPSLRSGCSRRARLINETLLYFSAGLNWLLRRHRQGTLTDLYVRPRLLWDLCSRSGFRLVPQEFKLDDGLLELPINKNEHRLELGKLESSDEFERVLLESLPQNFPAIYLESFKDARRSVLRSAEPFPSMMASTIGWFYNEAFRYAAAEASERGVRIVTVQHGGGYGIYWDIPSELHEREIGDRYLVNGWAAERDALCRNIPDPKMSSILPKQWNAQARKVLFVSTGQPRWLYRFHSNPVCDQWLEYVDWEIRFIRKLGAKRNLILFRDYPHEYGLHLHERVTAAFPDLDWDDRSASFYRRLQTSRITVIDHCGTSMLETLAANLPTVLFWNPKHWEVRPECTSDFDALRSAGILWDTPEDAAHHLSEVYNDVERWWQSAAVQDIRRRFVKRFALTDPHWADVWTDIFREEITVSSKMAYQTSAISKP